MLIDIRIYTYQPSMFRTFLKAYEERGFPLTTRHLGTTLGIFTSASGVANRTLQMFCYDDAQHRDRCRGGLMGDPAWGEFTKSVSSMIVTQENTLVRPTSSSKLSTCQGIASLVQASAARAAAKVPAMLFELRYDGCKPGRLQTALGQWHPASSTVTLKHVEMPIGRFLCDTGNTNALLTLDGYSSASERERRKFAREADQAARTFDRKFSDLCDAQHVTLFTPTSYSPLR
jgi:hypothetical protein